MRTLVVMLAAALGILTLSMTGESQETSSAVAPKSTFLSNLSVGETIIVQIDKGVITIFAGQNEQQLRKLIPTEEEQTVYQEANDVLELAKRTGNIDMEKWSAELKRIYEQPGRISGYVAEMEAKMRKKAHAVSRVGEDYLAYREENREVLIPIHQIQSITRLVQ